MPSVNREDVKAKRELLKKTFPKFKFSVRVENGMSISVKVLNGPFQLLKDPSKKYENVNYFYIRDHYKELPKASNFLSKVYEIINKGNYTITEDGDYGSIPKFYVDISVGSWDKPYEVK